MGDHDLLIRHAVKWAATKKLPLDAAVLETVLDLRDLHDEQRPQAWPSGSAEHLMLVRWPSHGPSEVPDPDHLVATLDTFWRFLRGSGRMAAGSADPKSLTKEARRAASRMVEACADPVRHGATKNLLEFGRSLGIDPDGAASVEELQERLDLIVQAWNELPTEERLRLSPGPSAHQGSAPGVRATSMAQSLAMGDLPGAQRLLDTWDDGPGSGDEELMPRRDPAVVARQVQASPFVQQVLRLADWVGQGRGVTATGVLRLAEARSAYADLGLREFDERRLHRRSRYAGWAGPDPDEVLARLRSAADLRSLDRLWQAAVAAQLIDVGRTRARQVPVEGRSTDEWVQLGMLSLTALYLSLPGWSSTDELLFAAVLMLLAHGETTLEELQEWWWTSPHNYLGAVVAADHDEETHQHLRLVSDDTAAAALVEFDDTGVWRRTGDRLHQTDLGYEIALLFASLKDQGLLGEDD